MAQRGRGMGCTRPGGPRKTGRNGQARRAGGGPFGALLALAFLAAAGAPSLASQAIDEGPSGLPLPRFVSLKAGEVNVRGGPGTDYRIRWIFRKAGLPVEIVQEFSNWRRIRDSEGDDGWVHHSLLAADRTALVVPWEAVRRAGEDGASPEPVDLYAQPDRAAPVVARLEPNVLASVRSCDGRWCLVAGEGWDGFVEQDLLWGVYPGEVFD